jgi:hypothetical protein
VGGGFAGLRGLAAVAVAEISGGTADEMERRRLWR